MSDTISLGRSESLAHYWDTKSPQGRDRKTELEGHLCYALSQKKSEKINKGLAICLNDIECLQVQFLSPTLDDSKSTLFWSL